MKHIHSNVLCRIMLTALLPPLALQAATDMPHPEAPRLVNYYLRTDIAGKEEILAQWDMLILPYQVWDFAPDAIAGIKTLNPDQLTIAYIDPVLIPESPPGGAGDLQHDFVWGVHPQWLAYDTTHSVISFWENALHVNISEVCPEIMGFQYRDYFIDYLQARFFPLIEDGMMDGIFLDEMSNGGYIWWEGVCGCEIDYDLDWIPDPSDSLEIWLTRSMGMFADSLRATMPEGSVLIGNNSKPRHASLNGKFYESYPAVWEGTLAGSLHDLDVWSSLQHGSNVACANGVWETEDRRAFRYRYVASLLADTYFSYDRTTEDHFQLTWYELFDTRLGLPVSSRYILGENPLILSVFEDPYDIGDGITTAWMADLILTREPALVLQGEQSLLIDVFANDPWPGLAKIRAPGGYEAESTYTISFRYRILDTDLPRSQLFLKTYSPSGGPSAQSHESLIYPGAEGLYRMNITTGEAADYEVILRSKGPVTLVMDSLTVVAGEGGLWARDYERGVVVCNDSDLPLTLPHRPDWTMVEADSQQVHYPEWAAGEAIELASIDGLVFRREGVSVDPPPPAAGVLRLGDPWPNPGNPFFRLSIAGESGARARLSLHDVSGRRLAQLWTGILGEGECVLDFDSRREPLDRLPSGVYLLRAESAGEADQVKWVLLR